MALGGFPRWAVTGGFVRLIAAGGTVGCGTSCRRQRRHWSVEGMPPGPISHGLRPTGGQAEGHFTMEGRRHEDCSSRARPGLRTPFPFHSRELSPLTISSPGRPRARPRASPARPQGVDGVLPPQAATGAPGWDASGQSRAAHDVAEQDVTEQDVTEQGVADDGASHFGKWVGPWATFEWA